MSKGNVDYSSRPNKVLVRKNILDTIGKYFNFPLSVSDNFYYITLSGYQLIDSVGFYERFGIKNIFSIENVNSLYRRALFNNPYEFIEIKNGEIRDFIDTADNSVTKCSKAIYLDYESSLNDGILEDIISIISSDFLNRKSLLFITFNMSFNKRGLTSNVKELLGDDIKSSEKYQEWIKENFSDFFLNEIQKKYGNKKSISEELKIFYKDTSQMVIIGYLIDDSVNDTLMHKIESVEYNLTPLTELEKICLQKNLSRNSKTLAYKLGISEDEEKHYIDLF